MTDRQDARLALLDKAVAYVDEHGLNRVSLRDLARELDTSHRMLIYHFGSRDGLLSAVLHRIRQDHQRTVPADAGVGRRKALDLQWRACTAPEAEHRVRAFLYVLGQAAQEAEPYEEFLASLNQWIGPLTDLGVAEGLDEGTARGQAELVNAAVRGLLISLVVTGDRDGAESGFVALQRLFDESVTR
ncbi:TetR/AcrR family transcriptional regulator [Planotetraspora silvatica]|nr:TetR/AcrR family transcriptional regulator [Planotetraspora silvatica]